VSRSIIDNTATYQRLSRVCNIGGVFTTGIAAMARQNRPHTDDGRYLVSKGILKRCTNPSIEDSARRKAIKKLMQARMAKDRPAAHEVKIELGEAGPVWWDDGAPDYSGKKPAETPYADWWNSLTEEARNSGA